MRANKNEYVNYWIPWYRSFSRIPMIAWILYNDVRCAEVHESSSQVLTSKQVLHHPYQFFLSLFCVNQLLILCDYCKSFSELWLPVLFWHMIAELRVIHWIEIKFITSFIILFLFIVLLWILVWVVLIFSILIWWIVGIQL
jgi:hypothetical protein